jgi:hypothetical protein
MFLYEFCSYYYILLLLIREVVGGQGGIISRLLLKRIEGSENSCGLDNKDREGLNLTVNSMLDGYSINQSQNKYQIKKA